MFYQYILPIIILVIFLYIFYIWRFQIEQFVSAIVDSNFHNIKKLKSGVDENEYYVQDMFENQYDAVNMIAEINNIIIHFIKSLKVKYPNSARVTRLVSKYNPESLMEGSPINNKNSTSYSVAKGKKLVFCLRSKKNKELHRRNLLMFVVLHELAHLMSVTYGHNAEFLKNFKFLLHEAMASGIYRYDNYFTKPREYCGINLTSTPV